MELKTLQTIAIIFVIIGIVLGIGILVLEEFEDEMATTTTTVVNETVQFSSTGTYVLKNYTTANIYCYDDFTIVNVWNVTAGVPISAGNFSYNEYGKVWNITADLGGNIWNVTYTYNSATGEACKSVETTVTSVNEIPGWLSIVIIILIAGIILVIVFKFIGAKGEGSEFSYSGGSGSGGVIAEV